MCQRFRFDCLRHEISGDLGDQDCVKIVRSWKKTTFCLFQGDFFNIYISPLGATKVIIADINAGRLELALKMGYFVTIDSSKVDLKEKIMEITDGNGIARYVNV